MKQEMKRHSKLLKHENLAGQTKDVDKLRNWKEDHDLIERFLRC